jgi:hypothetical protein
VGVISHRFIVVVLLLAILLVVVLVLLLVVLPMVLPLLLLVVLLQLPLDISEISRRLISTGEISGSPRPRLQSSRAFGLEIDMHYVFLGR